MLKFIFTNIWSYIIVVTLATFLSLSSETLGAIFYFLIFAGWAWYMYKSKDERKFAGWMYSGRLYDDLNKIPEKFREMAGKVYYER